MGRRNLGGGVRAALGLFSIRYGAHGFRLQGFVDLSWRQIALHKTVKSYSPSLNRQRHRNREMVQTSDREKLTNLQVGDSDLGGGVGACLEQFLVSLLSLGIAGLVHLTEPDRSQIALHKTMKLHSPPLNRQSIGTGRRFRL